MMLWQTGGASLIAVAMLLSGPAAPDGSGPRTIEVVAKRFAFEPELIEVVEGESVRLVLRSADVTHGLKIAGYDVEIEIPKGGEPVSVEFLAERQGSFRLECSEYCGSGHRGMRGELVVRAADGGAR